jgi:hypothetical protein
MPVFMAADLRVIGLSAFGRQFTEDSEEGYQNDSHLLARVASQPLVVRDHEALAGLMDTNESKHDGQMPEQPSDADEPSPNKGEQNPPIEPTDEPWSKQ